MRDRGELEQASELLQQAVELARGIGNTAMPQLSLHSLGDLERARRFYAEAPQLCRSNGNPRGIIYCLAGLASVCAMEGRYEVAAATWAAALAHTAEVGLRIASLERARYERWAGIAVTGGRCARTS